MLAGRGRHRAGIVQRPLGTLVFLDAQQRAGEEHEVVRAEQRRARNRVRGQALFEDPQTALDLAELQQRAAAQRRRPLHFLGDAVRVADHGELFVGLLDVARIAPRQVRENLEEQREGERLRMVERTRLEDGLLHGGKALIRETDQGQRARILAAAEDARFDAGLPDARPVERRVVELEPARSPDNSRMST